MYVHVLLLHVLYKMSINIINVCYSINMSIYICVLILIYILQYQKAEIRKLYVFEIWRQKHCLKFEGYKV